MIFSLVHVDQLSEQLCVADGARVKAMLVMIIYLVVNVLKNSNPDIYFVLNKYVQYNR